MDQGTSAKPSPCPVTFGLGSSLISASITEGIIRAETKPEVVITFSKPESTPRAVSKPSQKITPGYIPKYNGFGWPASGHTHGSGYQIPVIKNGFIL